MTLITGRLVCYRFAVHRRGRALGNIVADIVDPLPSSLSWAIEVDDPDQPARPPNGSRTFCYRTKTGNLPTALVDIPEGSTVTVTATVEPWSNGLGAYISRVAIP